MFDLDLWREIFQSINKNRTRSLLSGFTVAFAILLFTILFGIANGLNNTFVESFGNRTVNLISIYTSKTTKPYKGLQAGRQIQFKTEDYHYFKTDFKNEIQYVAPTINKAVSASFGSEQNSYSLTGVQPDNQYVDNTKIKAGRYINQNDILNKTKVIVIGKLVEEDLFLGKAALGEFINLSGISYKVVGICFNESDYQNRVIYAPITTIQKVYGNDDFIDNIGLTYNPNMSFSEATGFVDTLRKKIKARFSIAPEDQRAIYVRSYAEDFKKINNMKLTLNIVILIIGLGTLIAGIVGISNIMIFVVKERTKEIGIRKALGALPKSIVSIILIESILITTIAGYLGLVLGITILELGTPILEAYFIKNPSVSTSLVFSATITLIFAGAIAGYLPAKKASKIKPIVALRDD